jgi:glycosyltransferase involved in cell wall biosynthesis
MEASMPLATHQNEDAMKIVYVVPGFGNTFYCQNCVQNLYLIKAMMAHQHSVTVAPMYIPFTLDTPTSNETPVFFGAINVYLKEYSSWFKHLPAWIHGLLNSHKLLRWISHKSGTTDPKGLEKMTISVMEGTSGTQAEELNTLIQWLKNEIQPDVVHLSNALLVGIGVAIKKELNIPVFCTIQDENHWLDKMEEPFSSQGWQLIQDSAEWIDSFISASHYYANYVQQRLDLPANKFSVIPTGLDLQRYQVRQPSFDPPTIGYLSRITDVLGIDTLLRAFGELKKNPEFQNLRLKISGGVSAEDKHGFKQLKTNIAKQTYANDVMLVPNLYKEDINAFFESLTVLTVPSHEPEALGLFILESVASGIPVVQPAIGGYSELIQNTGGGIAYQPNTWQKLTETLSTVLKQPDTLIELSQQGRVAVSGCCSTNTMVSQLINLYQNGRGGVSPPALSVPNNSQQQEDTCAQ